MIIPLLSDGHVVLERQFRYPLKRTVIEFPAGKIDAGETALNCAQRELLEETGYRAGKWSYLGGLHNAIAYSDEKIEMFLAEELSHEGATLDAGETLEVFTSRWQQLLQWVREGTVTDVKTMVGVMWLEKVLQGSGSDGPLDRYSDLGRIDQGRTVPTTCSGSERAIASITPAEISSFVSHRAVPPSAT